MIRIIALLFALLLIGFELTKDSPAGSNQPQSRTPTQVDANYKATHRADEDLLVKVVQSLEHKLAHTPDATTAVQSEPESNQFAYTAKIEDGKVYLWFCNNPDPRCHFGPFVKTSDKRYSCAIDEINSHSLWNDSGRWFYISNQVQMAPCPVDGSVLEK